jgi:hypothetical protein
MERLGVKFQIFVGKITACGNTRLQNAIAAGPLGRIAATYVYWAGAGSQQQTVGWKLIDDATSANTFAGAIAAKPRPFGGAAGIGAAINFSAGLFGQTDNDGELLFTCATFK